MKLPAEDMEEGDEGLCGRLRVSMYGTRDAALNWAMEYAETLRVAGFKQGVANPCLFHLAGKNVTIMVHGDDFAAVGDEGDLVDVEKALADKYKIKTERLGGSASDAKEIRVLNKVLRYTPTGLEIEADPRHAERIIRDLKLANAKPSKVPGSKADTTKGEVISVDALSHDGGVAVHSIRTSSSRKDCGDEARERQRGQAHPEDGGLGIDGCRQGGRAG